MKIQKNIAAVEMGRIGGYIRARDEEGLKAARALGRKAFASKFASPEERSEFYSKIAQKRWANAKKKKKL